MSALTKRATVYFDPAMHMALQHKAQETSRTLSDMSTMLSAMHLPKTPANFRGKHPDPKRISLLVESIPVILEQLKPQGGRNYEH